MKILQINKFLYLKGGAEKYFIQLSELLKSRGHEVRQWGMAREDEIAGDLLPYIDFSQAGLASKPLKIIGRLFNARAASSKLAKALKDFQPDIVHIHNIYHQIQPSVLQVIKRFGLPIVMTVHDFKLICPNYSLFVKGKICQRCKKTKYYQCLLNHCIKQSLLASGLIALDAYWQKYKNYYQKYVDCFIVPSEFVRGKIIEFGFKAAEKIEVVPHFHQVDNDVEVRDKAKNIVYAGRLDRGKGLKTLIAAWSQIKTDWRLQIVGSGPLAGELKQQAEKLQLKNITFSGHLSQAGLQAALARSSLLVAPSEMYETFGLVILEAYAKQVPVLAADQPSYRELIEANQTGWFFTAGKKQDLAAKLHSLISGSQEQLALAGLNGFKLWQSKYLSSQHYKRIINLYQCLKNR